VLIFFTYGHEPTRLQICYRTHFMILASG